MVEIINSETNMYIAMLGTTKGMKGKLKAIYKAIPINEVARKSLKNFHSLSFLNKSITISDEYFSSSLETTSSKIG